MKALLTKIASIKSSDAELQKFFPGGGSHGWKPKPATEFRRYFSYRSAGKANEGAESTCDNTASKTVEDIVTIRFQCWADDDVSAMEGVALLRKKFMRLPRDLSTTDKLLQTEKGPEDVFEEPPDDDGNRLWQGVLDIVYHVQSQPYASAIAVNYLQVSNDHELLVGWTQNVTSLNPASLSYSITNDGGACDIDSLFLDGGKIRFVVLDVLNGLVKLSFLDTAGLTFEGDQTFTPANPYIAPIP